MCVCNKNYRFIVIEGRVGRRRRQDGNDNKYSVFMY